MAPKKSTKKKKGFCTHRMVHKKGTWYMRCTKKGCFHEVFLGLGLPPALNKVCHSSRQDECIMDSGIGGKMDPNECYGCGDFYGIMRKAERFMPAFLL